MSDDTDNDNSTEEERRTSSPSMGMQNTPNAERYVLQADAMRRRQLRSALLHGSSQTWREYPRTWMRVMVGAIVVAVILAGMAVADAFNKTKENQQEKQEQKKEEQEKRKKKQEEQEKQRKKQQKRREEQREQRQEQMEEREQQQEDMDQGDEGDETPQSFVEEMNDVTRVLAARTGIQPQPVVRYRGEGSHTVHRL